MTVKAGTTLGEVVEYLDTKGLALSNLPAITDQSIAGAISTGEEKYVFPQRLDAGMSMFRPAETRVLLRVGAVQFRHRHSLSMLDTKITLAHSACIAYHSKFTKCDD